MLNIGDYILVTDWVETIPEAPLGGTILKITALDTCGTIGLAHLPYQVLSPSGSYRWVNGVAPTELTMALL